MPYIHNTTFRKDVFDIHNTIQKVDIGILSLRTRKSTWSDEKKSRFIETVLLRYPIPNFAVQELSTGKYLVVDGCQRLLTILQFHSDDLVLKIPTQNILDGKKFSQMVNLLKNRFEDSLLTFDIIDYRTPKEEVSDILMRLRESSECDGQVESTEEADEICRCGRNKAGEPEECPYSSELYNETSLCNCCDDCRRECAMDICLKGEA